MRLIRARVHEIPDSKSCQIWAYLGDGGDDGRHGVVVGVFEMSKLRLLKKMKMVQMIPRMRCENGRN